MSIEGQGHFFTIYFPGFVSFVLYKATISGERLQDHWSSGFLYMSKHLKPCKTRIFRGSDYSPGIALSENKDTFRDITDIARLHQ